MLDTCDSPKSWLQVILQTPLTRQPAIGSQSMPGAKPACDGKHPD